MTITKIDIITGEKSHINVTDIYHTPLSHVTYLYHTPMHIVTHQVVPCQSKTDLAGRRLLIDIFTQQQFLVFQYVHSESIISSDTCRNM